MSDITEIATVEFFVNNQEKLATEIGSNPKTVYHRKYREKNRKKLQKQRRDRYHADTEKDKNWRQNGINRLRTEVLGHYGGKCAYCGEADQDVLVLARTTDDPDPFVSSSGGSAKRYRSIRRADFPPGYEVRCHNCDSRRKRGHIPDWEKDKEEADDERLRSLLQSAAEKEDEEIFGLQKRTEDSIGEIT